MQSNQNPYTDRMEFRMSTLRPEAKAAMLQTMYKVATFRKVAVGILTLVALLFTFLMLYLFRGQLDAWHIFLGTGASIIVFGVVMIFSNINDTYFDIASSLFPEDFKGEL